MLYPVGEVMSMSENPKNLDVVALTVDMSEHKLSRGQVGTVVETLSSEVFEVEFCDNDGHTYALLPLRADKLMVLHYKPSEVA
jgi:hypothetical protein